MSGSSNKTSFGELSLASTRSRKRAHKANDAGTLLTDVSRLALTLAAQIGSATKAVVHEFLAADPPTTSIARIVRVCRVSKCFARDVSRFEFHISSSANVLEQAIIDACEALVGSWIIGGSDAKENNFKCSRGVIYSKRAGGGIMPDKVGGVWMRLNGEKFDEDSDISVSVKPVPLYVQSSHGQQRCSGEYVPVAGRMANGFPVWEHIRGRCWLYSGTNGMWILGGTDAQAKNFQCTRG
ncbi:unnamed protein product, partial [Polarella glacialis]